MAVTFTVRRVVTMIVSVCVFVSVWVCVCVCVCECVGECAGACPGIRKGGGGPKIWKPFFLAFQFFRGGGPSSEIRWENDIFD